MYQIIKKTKKLLGSPNSGAVKSLVQEVLKEITKEKNYISFHNYIPIEKELNQTKEDLLNLSSAYDISSSISEEILNLRKKENHLTEVLKNQREQNTYIRKMISLIIDLEMIFLFDFDVRSSYLKDTKMLIRKNIEVLELMCIELSYLMEEEIELNKALF